MEYLLNDYRKQILDIDIISPYKREIFNVLKNEIKNKNICLVGLRQIGKTTLMQQLAFWYFKNFIKNNTSNENEITNVLNDEEKIFYTNVKLIQNVNSEKSREKLLNEIKNKKYKLILLDEIQEINEWTNFLQVAIDLNTKARFIVSGSNATALKNEIMVGRMKIFYINPLLFNEYKEIWKDDNIDQYLKCGSYPKNKNYSSSLIQYRELIKDSIIDKIINEDNKKSVDGSKFYLLLSNINNYIGNEINYSKLETKNITRQTVSSYIKIMKDAQLIHLVPKYKDKNTNRKQKVYFEDKSMIYFFNDFKKLNNNLKGSLVENVIFNYLNYKFMNTPTITNQIYYYRDNNNHEIDFVIPEKNLLIECKYVENIDLSEIEKELLDVSNTNKDFDKFRKIVITKNINKKTNSIEFISLKNIMEDKYEW